MMGDRKDNDEPRATHRASRLPFHCPVALTSRMIRRKAVGIDAVVRAHFHFTSSSFTPRPERRLSRACETRRRNAGSFSSR